MDYSIQRRRNISYFRHEIYPENISIQQYRTLSLNMDN